MNVQKRVLIVGAGFIGSNVLELLVHEGYHVSALVRRREHAEQISTCGASPILGNLDDRALISQRTSENDIVFHCAGADHRASIEAVLEGLSRRAHKGNTTIYIHTSGAKVLSDNALGAFTSERTYGDHRREDIDWVDDDAPHRPLDLTILGAQKQLGHAAKIAIMFPPEIYGYDDKHDRLNIMMPKIAQFTLKHGYAPYVGQGRSVETQVHVLDLARAYVTVLHWMEKAGPAELLANPYFFCENGTEFSWREAADEIGKAVQDAARVGRVEAKEVPQEMWVDLFGERTGSFMGLNCRSRAVRLRDIGWQPSEKGIWESFREDELPQILKRWEAQAKG